MTHVLSFVIPAKNEEKSIEKLVSEITMAIPKKLEYEIIFIDDGSTDGTYQKILSLRGNNKKIKLIKHRGNWGKSAALQNGFENASGDIIITMDADLQDNPQEIPRFLKKLDEGYDLVSGWKKERHDPYEKVIPSRIFNFLASTLTGVKLHDINCGFKAYRKEVLQNLHLYGELYRFIPILAAKQNYKVTEIPVDHRSRIHGKSKFGLERHLKGLLDLITVVFLTGYISRPSHFFGTLGFLSFGSGFVIGIYITYLRLSTGTIQYRQPLLFLGILLMVIGIQLATTGLIAEMIVNYNQRNNPTGKYISEKLL